MVAKPAQEDAGLKRPALKAVEPGIEADIQSLEREIVELLSEVGRS